MNQPKFRYIRRHGPKDLEPKPGVWAQAVSALRLGAALAVIIAIGVMYLRSAMGIALGDELTSAIVLISFLLPSAVVLGRAWWDKRHPKDPYAHLPVGGTAAVASSACRDGRGSRPAAAMAPATNRRRKTDPPDAPRRCANPLFRRRRRVAGR